MRHGQHAYLTTRRTAVRWLAGLGAGALAAASRPARLSGAPQTAAVVGTDALPLRADANPTSAILTRIPLGATATLAADVPPPVLDGGPATGDLVRVAYAEAVGYVPDYFLAADPAHVPYLQQGAEGCRRTAFIFNIGIGFPPDEGVLDTLQREQVPATMFVMGWWAAKRPPILTRLVNDGYLIGSHGYAAVDLTGVSDEAVAEDVDQAVTTIEQATGRPLARYATAYAGASDERVRAVVAAKGLLPILWTVAAADYGPDATEDSVYDHVMADMHDGAIVELHLDGPASAASTGHVLPRLIADLRDQGYRFVTIPEMMSRCADAIPEERA